MGWVLMKHRVCNLPELEELQKYNIEDGSMYKCTCGKLWVLVDNKIPNLNGQWHPVSEETSKPNYEIDWDTKQEVISKIYDQNGQLRPPAMRRRG